MYQRIFHDRRTGLIHLWDDKAGYDCFKYNKYAYKIDPNGDHVIMTGLKVSRVTSWTKEDESEGLVFEHDVNPAMRVLIDQYSDSDDVSVGHTTLFFDIEVSKEKKYSKPQDAANPITAISYYDTNSQDYVCLLVNDHLTSKEVGHIKLKVFRTERGLLQYFLNEWERIDPSIVTGWNSSNYDIPYLFNRLKRVLSYDDARRLSPVGIAYIENFAGEYSVKIAGVNCMDYMVLYKKFIYNEEPSYKLEAIAQKELGKGKIHYEGSLDDLYRSDIAKFIDYNVRDVELIVDLDKKLDFIAIAQGICHKGHVPYEDFPMSSRYLDGASLTYCKRNNMIAMSSAKSGKNIEQAVGAYVKLPKSGMYKYLTDWDVTSLYPSTIITLNISPETKWGKILDWDEVAWAKAVSRTYEVITFVNHVSDSFFESAKHLNLTFDELKQLIDSNKLSIASNGMLYRTDVGGVVPTILDMWFSERTRYSTLAEEYYNSGDSEQYQYFNRKQLIQKILLNSFYGVLLLPSFRFYDKDNGEAVTITGRSIIQYGESVVNRYYNAKLNTDNVDYVTYIDTDALIASVLPLIRIDYDGDDQQILIDKTLYYATEIQHKINSSIVPYAKRFHNVKNHRWAFKQEMIASRGFWGSMKKRYAMWLVYNKGLKVDKPDIKGFDVVRSNFPKAFRSFMKQIIIDILHDKDSDILNSEIADFKVKYKKESITSIMLPTSVKEISKFGYGQKGTPIHVKSAQNYNKLLELLNIESIPPIDDGDKILWAYLRPNPYNFDTIALTGYDDPVELVEFVDRYIDKDALFDRVLMTKLQSIWDDLRWGQVILQVNDEYF